MILDTNEGTITEFYHTGSHITVPYEEYEALPEAEKWKAHRTRPTTELLDNWTQRYEKLVWMLVPNPIRQPVTGRFYSRAVSSAEEELLVQQGQLEPWHIQDDSSSNDNREESEDDRERKRKRKHVVVGLEVRPSYIEVAKANLIYAGCLQHISLPPMARSLRQGAM